ncbi:MAG: phenylacetate-CoA oxygenase subunit PaaC [Betaproteobacteria bacterium]|nr:MAG: phenylacetate-CoA oxygenase subunit PaaC [Betaproteobacteria bacterium]
MASDQQLLDYVLRLADSDLILAQRLGEWVGHGPVLEEDIALTNVGLDLLGQARLWFAYAGEIEAREVGSSGAGRSEDEFAYMREGGGFRNLLLAEQPNGNYADTTARQFYFDVWHELLLRNLAVSRDRRIAEIATKALKEVMYHAERSADWVIRLGDGTELSHTRMQSGIDELWMYTGEMFAADDTDLALAAEGVAADVGALLPAWRDRVAAVLDLATLTMPSAAWMQRGGKQGVHSEHLGHLLAEMQSLQRAHPGAQW